MAEWYVPLTLAVLFFIFEVPTRTFYLAALGLSMLLVTLVDIFARPNGLGAVLWLTLFVVLLLPVAEYMRRLLRNRASSDATNIDRGRRVVVLRASPQGRLEVRYRDSLWEARLTEPVTVLPGQELEIVSRDGNCLVVAPTSSVPH